MPTTMPDGGMDGGEMPDVLMATDDSYETVEDTALIVDVSEGVLANDNFTAEIPPRVELLIDVSEGRLSLGADGAFTYEPAADFDGQLAFTYQLRDGERVTEPARVVITVTPVNDAPAAAELTLTTDEDSELELAAPGVLEGATDPDGDALLSRLDSEPINGVVVLAEDGSLTYTPDADFAGADSFTFVVFDGELLSEPATVSIEVRPVDDAPVGQADRYSVDEDTALTVPAPGLLFNDSDAEGAELRVELVATTDHGLLELSDDGSFVYTPDDDFAGLDGFSYRALDGTLSSEAVEVSLEVVAVADAPRGTRERYELLEDDALQVDAPGVLENDFDPDGDSVVAQLVDDVSFGQLVLSDDGAFSYTPNADFAGVDRFRYRAFDGLLPSAPIQVELDVVPVNDAPVALADAYAGNEDEALSVDAETGLLANDRDLDGDDLEALRVTGAANGTVALEADGSFTYTPDVDFNGRDSFSYRVSDGETFSEAVTVTLDIAARNDAPQTAEDRYAAIEDTELVIAAPGVLENDSDPEGDALLAELVEGPTQGELNLRPDGSFTYRPAPDFHGEDGFSYRASDGSLTAPAPRVIITVAAADDPPRALGDSYRIEEDQILSVAAPGVLENDSDPDGDALSAELVEDVTHGILTLGADGSVTYAPNPDFSGVDAFQYRVNSGELSSVAVTVTLAVGAAGDPPTGGPDSYAGTEDTPIDVPAPGVLANDSDLDGDALVAELLEAPAHGSADLAADGGLRYVPEANFAGQDSLSYRVFDGTFHSPPIEVQLTVAAVNDPPVGNDLQVATDEDQPRPIALAAIFSDIEGDALLPELINAPEHGSVALTPELVYTPEPDFHGSDSFGLRASDAGGLRSNAVLIRVEVAPLPDAPVAGEDSFAGTEDEALAIAAPGVLENDSDADGDALRAVLVSAPAEGTVDFALNEDGGFALTPAPDFSGTIRFRYRSEDGGLFSAPVDVEVEIAPVNDPPTAQALDIQLPEDVAVDITLQASDADGDALTFAITAAPQNGRLSGSGAVRRYTPNPGFSGSDAFSFVARDGRSQSDPAQVQITVNSVNDLPVAAPESYAVFEDTALDVAAPGVLGNDSDADGDALSAALLQPPLHGTVDLMPDGSFRYVPEANFNGDDGFSYRADDGLGFSDSVDVAINVQPVNDAPEADPKSLVTAEDTPADIILSAADTDEDALTFSVFTVPQHGTLTGEPPLLRYTPDAGYTGSDSFSYRAFDGLAFSAPADVDITVEAVPEAPLASDDSYTGNEDTELIIDAPGVLDNDSDPDGDSLSAQLQSQPAMGSVSLAADGSFRYTPPADFNGSVSFTYLAFDGGLFSGTTTVTLNITAVNDGPVAQSGSATTDEDTPVSITLVATDVEGDPLGYEIVTAPAHGTLSGTAPDLTFTPEADWFGEDSFTFRADDGQVNSAGATIVVTVRPVDNDAPVAEDVVAFTSPSASVDVMLLATDPDQQVLSFDVERHPDNGSVVINGDTATYTPDAGFFGVDSFDYSARDGGLSSGIATVTVTVVEPASCQALLDAGASIGDGVYTIDPDGIGGEAAFDVFCDMSTQGGGWLTLELDDPDGVVVAHYTASNPWTKCDDDSARFYQHVGNEADLTPESAPNASHTYSRALNYLNPATGAPFTNAQLALLRDQITELAEGTRMVATEADSDGGGDVAGVNTSSGHDVRVQGSDTTWLHLTPGRNGDCGGSSGWPVAGRLSGAWLWHSSAALSVVDGDVGGTTDAQLTGIPQTHLLPTHVELGIYTGGGASFGWEQRTIRVR